jgi:hypothetical protein
MYPPPSKPYQASQKQWRIKRSMERMPWGWSPGNEEVLMDVNYVKPSAEWFVYSQWRSYFLNLIYDKVPSHLLKPLYESLPRTIHS